MGRIFISAAHGGREAGGIDPGSIAGGTSEAREMILLRDLIVTELRARSFDVLAVPDDLSAAETIAWINSRGLRVDVSLEIHADTASSPAVRGGGVYYIANNQERKTNAELLLMGLLRRVTQLPNRGVKPDTDSGLGSLAFCRQITIPSLLMQVGFLSSPEDRFLLQNRRRDFAVGIADGLASWSRVIDPSSSVTPVEPTYPAINININGQKYGEQGILVNGNSYIPIDLVDRLRIDVSQLPNINRISYRKIVYMKAVDLRIFNVSIGWDGATRTINLRSNLLVCVDQLDRIMSRGNTSEVELQLFLRNNNENALLNFSDIPKLYREEGNAEGVNYDIAFCQMCLETGFLRFGGDVRPEQNNFAGLGSIGGGAEPASFSSARIGVRAHIQHLKAYASLEPLVNEVVDPRFRFVTRGIAPSIYQLAGRWSVDLDYGTKILALMKRLYESAKLL
ncbi:N-acetylmuramoyl-L-alanine amidase [Nodularia spumigena CS-591/04]|uniref:hormogonium tapered terminus morphoprotein TftA n=1 Tax=Nodularia spumigena TaxID=70799 RepID=UPI002330CDB0|nr:N-acetylmuramoyl-L-alanine amidase [Nodularia spumigena]MDB9323825.1 N-acetylmuramoyl-L-alanine amidase [Nodularia spumigena CS-591/07A]MDB9329688.1 N-acetylmuramoyl-L-alanine amidase [Nodularia spumigena CS-591/04]MDB9349295.1 N-acetylmuramoyl-L-alanine amidase [Nodularia spumigena CS-588/01]MDB9353443.1 N-acetylmuramoyl-L-alanine amidase [Nodularia spumigena CS-588/05]MDB9361374.1 N-acetylmuramoyl-L-alanine amidase [Nodularia spumigena CS-588/02]